jgi:class 3 adenylate cyclase
MTKQLETPILIDSGTQSGLGGNIDLHDLGPVELKGKQEQVQIFSVLRAAPVL